MRNLGGHIGVAIFGLITFALTVAAVTVLDRLTGFNLFSLSVWVVVPVGAIVTGMAAASGYYFGSLFFHTRPTWFLLVQVLVVAALAMGAIYYFEYATIVLDNGVRVADYVGFQRYMEVRLTSSHLRIGRGQTDTGAVGDFGYVLAAIRFVGFVLGGFGTWAILRSQPVCQTCSRYLRKLTSRAQRFEDQNTFGVYWDHLFKHPVDSPEFSEWLRYDPTTAEQKVGDVLATSTLKGCPHCKTQLVAQTVQVMNKQGWSDVHSLTRNIRIPVGIDLRPIFKGPPVRPQAAAAE